MFKYHVPRSGSAPFLERCFEINLPKLAASLPALAANPACAAIAASHLKAACNLSSLDKVEAFVSLVASTAGAIVFMGAPHLSPSPRHLLLRPQ